MGLVAVQQAAGIPEGNAPVWNTTPAPIFSDEAVAENYDLNQHTSGATSYTLQGGTFPTGVTISGTNLAYDGLGSAGTTAGITLNATNSDDTTVSSSFSIVIDPTPAAQTFPIFEWYKAVVEYRGGVIIPLSNTRFWDKPVYPTVFTSTQTSLAALETAANAAAPGDVIALQDGTYAQNDIVITASNVAIVSETLGGADISNSEIQQDANFGDIMGFVDARYDINGDDNLIAYGQRNATANTDFTSDGNRNRFCYHTLQGKSENDQYWNIVGAAAKAHNRIDHNHFLRHIGSDLPSGGSEHGQVGQNQIEVDYFLYLDNDYGFEHLADDNGDKTIANEAEKDSLKSSKNMVVQCVIKICNSHINVRAGRECTVYACWFIGTTAERAGGVRLGGTDNLLACCYFRDLNNAGVNGESAMEADGGTPGTNREATDRSELCFNGGYDCEKSIAINRSDRTNKPTNLEIHSNSFKGVSASPVLWVDNSATAPSDPNFSGNVWGPTAGITDAGVLEETPELTLDNGYYVPTTAGNVDGASAAISTMGPIIIELSAQGVLVDLLGNTIPATGADAWPIQSGGDLTTDPVQKIIDASGHGA